MVEDPDFVRVVDVDGRKFRVEFSFLALCRLERAMDRTFVQIATALLDRKLSMDLALEMIRAGLNGRGDELWSKAQVADLYARASRPERMALSDAAVACFDALFSKEFGAEKPKEAPPGKGDAPPQGPGPTGPASSATPPAQG